MKVRPTVPILLSLLLMCGLLACASTPSGTAPKAKPQASATAVPASSPFAKLQIGMSRPEVQAKIGAARDFKIIPSGKAWIPFYYGADRTRTIDYYKNEGRLVYSGGDNRLIEIVYDPQEDGYRD
jgi:hypothetical protein